MRALAPFIFFLFASLVAGAGPSINVSPLYLNSFGYAFSSNISHSQRVTLQSSMMGSVTGSGTITVASSVWEYELSLNNSTFSNSVTIPYAGDTLGTTYVYIRLKIGLPAKAYNHQTLTVTATGSAVAENIDVSGVVTASSILIYFYNWTATSIDIKLSLGADTPDFWEYKVDQLPADPTTGTITTTQYAQYISGLAPNTLYQLHFRSKYDINYTPWQILAFMTTPTAVPQAVGNNGITLSPNPSSGSFIISGDVPATFGSRLSLNIVDVLSRVVWSGNTAVVQGHFNTQIQTSLPRGIYTVVLTSGRDRLGTRLVIQN